MKMNKLPLLFLFALVAISSSGCSKEEQNNNNSGSQTTGGGTGGGGQGTGGERDGLSPEKAFTVEQALNKMTAAGDGNVVDRKEYYVTGIFDTGTFYDYSRWNGTTTSGGKVFCLESAGLASSVSVQLNNVNNELDGATYIAKGYLELYQGKYKMGYLPANVSPTSNKYNPTIVALSNVKQGGGGTGGGGSIDVDIPINNDEAVKQYYSSISSSLSGTALRSALNTLNNNKIGSKPGYNGLKSLYSKIDADPTGSGKILGFYDNKLIGPGWDGGKTWNREHVWPDSLGGNKVEGDAYMPRPTAVSANSSRGNKYYAEVGAFDPGYAIKNYRGIAARIIFYCAIADTSLNIIDNLSGKGSMGKLSDLLKWNLEYLPSYDSSAAPELRCEYLKQTKIPQYSNQKNRNPFVDHPEYACKIWGTTNSSTQSICQKYL